MKKILCKLFGHSYTEIDVLIAQIEMRSGYTPVPTITCKRCGMDVIQEALIKKENQ